MQFRRCLFLFILTATSFVAVQPLRGADPASKALLDRIGVQRGVVTFLGLPEQGKEQAVVQLGKDSELMIYVQTASADEAKAIRKAAEAAGLLGKRIWVDQGNLQRIQLADNIADAVLVGPSAKNFDQKEVMRVLHPQAKAFFGKKTILVKPTPKGLDAWDHPYHGPDNNPQSTDQVARYPFLTQFLGEPMFGCISEVTVGSGGRIFKAFGHIAFRGYQNEVLNKLYGINAYNGTILWTRPLKKGFMIHRNTMVATPDTLFLADDESCKLIDAATGKVKREIKPDPKKVGGTVWKWMALKDGVLYAMLGGKEVPTQVKRGPRGRQFGGWPWGMWPGYDYKNPKTAFGFGQDIMAIEVSSGKVLWHHQDKDFIDARGFTMRNDRIYAFSPQKFLLCLDTKNGKPIWKSTDTETLAAIGPNTRAQGYITGFASTCYMKSGEKFLFFAGPQRARLVCVSAKDGRVVWQKKQGNYQLVLRDDALYAFGAQKTKSFRLDPATGKVLQEFNDRRACTRATGSVDSVFCRARGGTLRFDPSKKHVQHIAPMRPACHDGVIISEGRLYWGPWICFCNLSLFGHICLGPAGEYDFNRQADENTQLVTGQGNLSKVASAPSSLTFAAAPDGVVRALDANKKEIWKAYTGGEINFAPVLSQGRVFVGSNDGRVYAYEAATGRLLWQFRAAPQERKMPVYGKLMSTWPVAGGVVVDDGVVYAAAGIAHYDGTHVYALDAVTGKIKWHNGSSGFLNPTLRSGVSLQGKMSITGSGKSKALSFAAGNAVAVAKYDAATGKCLTTPPSQPVGVGKSRFYLRDFEKRIGLSK